MSSAISAAARPRYGALWALALALSLSSSLAGANTALTISGTPPARVLAAHEYAFQPHASVPAHDKRTFYIVNKPSWASFTPSTGRLYGTPVTRDVGTFSRIIICVDDGGYHKCLPRFAVKVVQAASLPPSGVTVSWMPPTENTNGSTLTNLAGYHLYYGTSRSDLNHVIDITNPGLAAYVVSDLSAATWYFALTSINAAGMESPRSTVVSTVVE
ncbi:MAG: hypothetical protein ACREUL_18375 [Steroidobacteraceae bacterium]